jgi:CheY-like chemotaxis protein
MPQDIEKIQFPIVIAEDNAGDVMVVRQALKEHRIDCTIRVLSNGEEALMFLDEADGESGDRRMDLLVLDLNLPGYDRETVLRRLRSMRRYAETPVIVMTALDADAPEIKRATEIASACFPKPFTLDECLQLGAIVRGLLQDRSVIQTR